MSIHHSSLSVATMHIRNVVMKQYQWINNGEEIILTFETEGKSESDKLNLGIYNVKSKKMRIPKNK